MITQRTAIPFLAFIMLTLMVMSCDKDPQPPFKIQLVGGIGQIIQPVQGDINGDGKPDLVAASFSGTNRFATIFVNTSTTGTLNYPGSFRRVDIKTGNYNHASVADVDGDGKLDIIVSNAGVFSVLRQNNNPDSLSEKSFDAPVTFNGSANGIFMMADMDNDRKQDFIIWNYSKPLTIIKNQSNSGAFTQASFGNSVNVSLNDDTREVEIADLNNDGLPEIITNNGTQIHILSNKLTASLLPNSFGSPITIDVAAMDFKVKDMDGDSRAEIIIQRSANTLTVYKNDGSGSAILSEDFARAAEISFGSTNVLLSGWAIDDMNNDAFNDIVVGANDTDGLHTIKIFKSSPGATDLTAAFSEAPFVLTTDLAASNFAIADFDADGKKDISCMLVSVLIVFRNQNFF